MKNIFKKLKSFIITPELINIYLYKDNKQFGEIEYKIFKYFKIKRPLNNFTIDNNTKSIKFNRTPDKNVNITLNYTC